MTNDNADKGSDRRPHNTIRGPIMQKLPEGACTTQTIATRLTPEERLNQKYLRYANVHTLLSEALNEPISWRRNTEKTAVAVNNALEKLGVMSAESEEAFAKYQFLGGFRGFSGDEARLSSFEDWLQAKEENYKIMATVYADLGYAGRRRLGMGTTQDEVLAACDAVIAPNTEEETSIAVVSFPELIESKITVGGTEITWGQMEKEKFDCWLQANPEQMVSVSKSEELMRELGRVNYQNSQLEEKDAALENRLREVTEELRNARLDAMRIQGEKNGLSERVKAREKELETAQKKISILGDKNANLSEINEQRLKMIQEANAETEKAVAELNDIRAQNAEILKRMGELESRFAALTAKVEGRDSGELTEEDVVRPTVLSTEPPLPPAESFVQELGRAADAPEAARLLGRAGTEAEELEEVSAEDVGAEVEAALEGMFDEEARLPPVSTERGISPSDKIRVPAAAMERIAEEKATVREPSVIIAPEALVVEPTDQIDLDDAQVVKEVEYKEITPVDPKKERGRRSNIGMRLEYLLYPFRGDTDLKYPPKPENFENDTEYVRTDRAYRSWCGHTGRWINNRLENISSIKASIAERKNERVAAGVMAGLAVAIAVGLAVTGGEKAQKSPEQMALSELAKPTVTQVVAVDDVAPEEVKEVKKVEPKPEPLPKPALGDVLAKHGLELGEGTNMANFYRGLNVEDVQEKYVILEEALRTDEQLQKYERKYSEGPILEMYADFLNTAIAYVQLGGQAYSEQANARAVGERVATRLEKLTQQKRIKKKVGSDRASEMNALAVQFTEFAGELPSLEEAMPKEERMVEVPVVTPEELEEMKKAGGDQEVVAVILPDKTDEKPFDVEKEMGKVVKAEFESLDTPSSVNEFNRKAGKVKKLGEKFLMQAHLTDQIVEHEMGPKMSEKRIMFMHLDTMNVAVKFAMAEGQGMTAVAEAMNVFDVANGEVKRLMGYRGMQKDLGKTGDAIEKNITWLRNRAEELKNKVDAYEAHKDDPLPLPGSPALENGNGAPTAVPETVKMDRTDNYTAMQTKAFSDHGLSIFEHPLKVQEKMRGMKINSFDKFVIMEKLVDEVMKNPKRMDGLTKAEQFEMLGIMADFLDAVRRAANEPKYWPAEYGLSNVMLDSLAIDTSDEIGELRGKRAKDSEPPRSRAHLYFSLDEGTFDKLGAAKKAFDEQLNYEYRQKARMKDTDGE